MGVKQLPCVDAPSQDHETSEVEVFEVSGSIKWFDASKGYGFVGPDGTKGKNNRQEEVLEGAIAPLKQTERNLQEPSRSESVAGEALQEATADLKEIRAQLYAMTQSHRELEEKLNGVYASWSWRLTMPLRYAIRYVFHCRNSLRQPRRRLLRAARAAEWLVAENPVTRRLRLRALKAEYRQKKLDLEPDTFVLYRIIGNDLYPRHRKGQSRENLKFILDNEPTLENCEKRWVVNRIVDEKEEAAIISLLEQRKQPYLHIPFDLETYARIPWDFENFPRGFFLRGNLSTSEHYERARAEVRTRRHKNNYVMNNNGARNLALRDGRARAKWVLPWDGNCFVTEAGWAELIQAISDQPYLKYFAVPMARIVDNQSLLDPTFSPETAEEPQLLFRRDAKEEFDEAVPYGRRPKVELLWRLRVRGPWDNWQDDAWDLPRRRRSDEARQFGQAGWVGRLFSGRTDLETASKSSLIGRGMARVEAISATLNYVDEKTLRAHVNPNRLIAYDEEAIAALSRASDNTDEAQLLARLCEAARAALARGPYSVVDKMSLPPSGDRHDYWHPAPYWWPNPDTEDGLPYVWRDGERIPGTKLFEPESEKYDRTRLQRLFDDTTVLALAWQATQNSDYADHGARLVRHWFIDPESRMNPHLRYAQIRRGHNNDEGASAGIIEMKDLYFFLDAVRILCYAGALDELDREKLSSWLRQYLDWLVEGTQGAMERQAKNNHGTCYDLQVAAIAAYLGDLKLLRSTLRDSQERLLEQFEPDGRQPHELARSLTAHYVCFNLQSWTNLALLAERCGLDFWYFSADDGRSLRKGLDWLTPFMAGAEWRWPQMEPFDTDRYWPLYYAYADHYGPSEFSHSIRAPAKLSVKPMFFPHDGIKPFWMLESGLRRQEKRAEQAHAYKASRAGTSQALGMP